MLSRKTGAGCKVGQTLRDCWKHGRHGPLWNEVIAGVVRVQGAALQPDGTELSPPVANFLCFSHELSQLLEDVVDLTEPHFIRCPLALYSYMA